MPSIALITAALALAGSGLATPVDIRKREFTVEQIERKTFLKNGPASVVKTFKKFNKTVPDHILQAAQRGPSQDAVTVADAGSGSAAAAPEDAYDSLYLTPVQIAGKTLHLDFDTGSSDL